MNSSTSVASSPADHLSPQEALRTEARTPSGPGGVPSPFSGYESGSTPAPVARPTGLSNVADLELLHNYSTSTAYTISNVTDMQSFYRVNVPQLGFSHPFVLHAIMALSARHLAHFRVSKRASYIAKADHHWEIGLRTASALIPTVNDDNAPALYIFAVFSCFYTLAKGPKPRDFLIFSDNGLAEWLMLLRGVRAIMETTNNSIRHGPLSPLFATAIVRVQRFHDHAPASDSEHARIAELRQLVTDIAGDSPNLSTYLSAIDDISRCFACVFDESRPSPSAFSQTVFIWLYRVSDDFVLCLQQRQPVALTIFAYFVVLMNELGTNWWMQGWIYHLLAGIHDALDEGSRPWIRWPMEKLGWIPDS